MAARPNAQTTTMTVSAELASAVQPSSRLDRLRRHRSQRDVKKKTVAAPPPSFSYVESSKAGATLAVESPTNLAVVSSGSAPANAKSRSRASRASGALAKLSFHFFKSRRASDTSDRPDTVVTPATSEEHRFWPRRLLSEKKVTPALPSTTPEDPSQEQRNPVRVATVTDGGKSDALRDPTAPTGATASADPKARSGNSKSRVTPSHVAPQVPARREPPFTPQYVFQTFADELTELEKAEVLEYGEIYFLSSLSIKSRRRGGKLHATSASSTAATAPSSDTGVVDSLNPTEPATACERPSPSSSSGAATSSRPTGLFNDGYDDERGDYLVLVQDHLAYRYEVLHTLGAGSFGQVVCCLDHETQQRVAIKIIRNRKRYREQSLLEVQILTQLQHSKSTAAAAAHIVHMRAYFLFRSHLCIVFDLLGMNLYEYLKLRFFQGLPLANIRDIAVQLVATLRVLKRQRVVHCDLKPENILVQADGDAVLSPFRATAAHASTHVAHVCIIDFGSSCLETAAVFTYIQSRFYRSPEVILGVPYTAAIDMWSLGCILAELYTGHPLFAGENEIEQLACIMELLGPPPHDLLLHARRRKHFFTDTPVGTLSTATTDGRSDSDRTRSAGLAPLAAGLPLALQAKPFVNSRGRRRVPGSRSLSSAVQSDDRAFLAFVRRCLAFDPRERMTPEQAARDPWLFTSDDADVAADDRALNDSNDNGNDDDNGSALP